MKRVHVLRLPGGAEAARSDEAIYIADGHYRSDSRVWLQPVPGDGSSVSVESVEPPPVVPTEVTMRQARLALRRAGKYGQIQAALNQLPEPAKTDAQIEWEYSSTLQRSHPLVATIGDALGLTAQQLDELFITASTL